MIVNGSWTQAHINSFLPSSNGATIIYPPCDTKSLCSLPLENRSNSKIVSLAQFRPEKEQKVQIQMLKNLFDLNENYRNGNEQDNVEKVTLTLMGSCRNSGDEMRIEELKTLARESGVQVSEKVAKMRIKGDFKHLILTFCNETWTSILNLSFPLSLSLSQDNVEFLVNAPWSDIIQKLSTSGIGLSTMIDEHFGMNVVEFMASGVITLSHASAGPLLDIAIPVDGRPTGESIQ